MMNLETNRFEEVLPKVEDALEQFSEKMSGMSGYVRHDGSEVPKGYPIFGVGEEFQLKGYRFKVKAIKEDEIIFEPVGPVPISKMRSVVHTKKGNGSSKKKKKSGSKKKR
jgi:uncharacterized Zn finger protein